MKKVSVILPTYKPDGSLFRRTLEGLGKQDFPADDWELLIVASGTPVSDLRTLAEDLKKVDVRFIHVEEPGLTRARLAGIREANGQILVFTDDDNILANNYLTVADSHLAEHKQVVVAGGKSHPEFEGTPPHWIKDFHRVLALRDRGDQVQITSLHGDVEDYPDIAPIGAGMVLRRSAARGYDTWRSHSASSLIADRTGAGLSSGGDNDIVLYCLKHEGEAGYFPELILHHVIPRKRLYVSYLARLNYESSRSWVRVLACHDICPWTKLNVAQSCLRMLVSFLRAAPWGGASAYIKWRGICGHYRGRTEI